MQVKKLQTMTSRTGRHMQRYNEGSRQVVGCIPFRVKEKVDSPSKHGTLIDDLEVLLISSQKSERMMFPKGGWETDETIEEAAGRETLEEAGVLGILGEKLGIWSFKSKSQDAFHEGYMLPLLVTEELDVWPEKDVRHRRWMSFNEARDACSHQWMREALDCLIKWMKEALDCLIKEVTPLQRMEDEHPRDVLIRQFMLVPRTEGEHPLDGLIPQTALLDGLIRQLKPVQRIDGKHLTTCLLEFLRSKEPLLVQSGEEEVRPLLVDSFTN